MKKRVVIAIATLALIPRAAFAQEERREEKEQSVAMQANRGLQLGIGPVLLLPTDGGPAGGGLDLEVRYGFRAGPLSIAPGGRLAGYILSSRGVGMAMPTVRITLPVGPLAPFVVGGVGGGWIGSPSESGASLLAGGGLLVHLGRVIAIGAEATYQTITGTELEMIAIGPSIRIGG